ncbi:MAG: glycosyltransferase [Gemmatimonadaceae bacterium]|jgi:glycosyltransferase involved in cell wall biosynthesis|nr:glycosyltransferase [Gemmatimonadaceae bacterium]
MSGDAPRLLVAATTPMFLRSFLLPFARHYRARGWRVDALAREATRDPQLRAAFDAVHDARWARQPLAPGNVAAARALSRLVRAEGYDIVHVHTPVAAFVTRAALRRSWPNHPVRIYTAHGFHFHRGGKRLANAAYATLERLGARWTDELVVINDDDEQMARAMRLVPPDRLHRMHGIGVDVARYARDAVDARAVAAVRTALGVDATVPLVVHVAEFTANKRQRDVVDALVHEAAKDWHVAFVGDGAGRAAVEAHAVARGVRARTHFTGHVGDPRPFMRAADVVVLVSEREGLPRSVLEAMCMEVPVVGTRIRGTSELLADERGRLVPVGAPAAIAAAIDATLRDTARARRACAAAEFIRRRYSSDAVLDAHDRLYSAALARRPTRGRTAGHHT